MAGRTSTCFILKIKSFFALITTISLVAFLTILNARKAYLSCWFIIKWIFAASASTIRLFYQPKLTFTKRRIISICSTYCTIVLTNYTRLAELCITLNFCAFTSDICISIGITVTIRRINSSVCTFQTWIRILVACCTSVITWLAH